MNAFGLELDLGMEMGSVNLQIFPYKLYSRWAWILANPT